MTLDYDRDTENADTVYSVDDYTGIAYGWKK